MDSTANKIKFLNNELFWHKFRNELKNKFGYFVRIFTINKIRIVGQKFIKFK